MRTTLFALLFIFLALGATAGHAAQDTAYVPTVLEPWEQWVLHDSERHFCPTVTNNASQRVCVFPASVGVTVEDKGASFEMVVHAYAEERVVLPYVSQAPASWPQDVTVNGEPGLVLDSSGRPSLLLAPGEWRITGFLPWAEAPEILQLPENAALLTLVRHGEQVRFPDLTPGGRLRLADKPDAGEEKRPDDSLDVRIFRLVQDTLPMEVTTLLRLDVSGRARRTHLENVLPEGGVPLQVDSPLPLSFSNDGGVYLQVRPGSFDVRITTRLQGQVEAMGPVQAPYGMEFWAFAAEDDLRVVEVQGVPGVDPKTTDMPPDWQRYPAYIVEPDATVTFKQMHRGVPESMPDRLSISRFIWLDFDGNGATVRDEIQGNVHSDWTLAMLRPGELGRASVQGKDQPVVMLAGDVDEKTRLPGVELRDSAVQLTAESRYKDVFGSLGGELPTTGWDREFDEVSAYLQLPPGWRLVTAFGMDRVNSSWISRWTLLDIFLCLVVVLAVAKLRSVPLALAALAFLALSWQEPGSPRLVWLFLLGALALYQLFSQSERLAGYRTGRRLSLWLYSLAMVTIVAISVPFIYHQVSWGLFPQLGSRYQSISPPPGLTRKGDATLTKEMAEAPMPSQMNQEMEADGYFMEKRVGSASTSRGGAKAEYKQKASSLMYDPEALVQTGPGLPDWSWIGVELHWSGPVAKGENMELVLLSPGWTQALGVFRILLLCLLLFRLLDLRAMRLEGDKPRTGAKAAAGAAAAVLLLLAVQPVWAARQQDNQSTAQQIVQQVQAQQPAPPSIQPVAPLDDGGVYPPQSMLDELRRRLLEPAPCFPACLSSPRMELSLAGDELRLSVEMHSAAETAAPLPRVSDRWTPTAVLVDDAPATDLFRKGEDIYVALPKGAHRIVLSGPAPRGLSFQVSFPLQSRQGAVDAPGWSVQGLGSAGELEGSLRLARNRQESRAAAAVEAERETYRIPPFMHVEREITLGLQWEVRTVVRRVSPTGEPVHLEVPLLPGESVLSEDVRVKDSKAVVQFSPGQRELSWNSRLEKAPVLELKAPESVPWVETWRLVPSNIWHLEISGIPAVGRLGSDGSWRPTWRPWPGEDVRVQVTRPQAAPGASMTIDGVTLTQRVGNRLDENELLLNIRASKGGRHSVSLPEGAELTALTASNRDLPLVEGAPGEVEFPLQPGEQQVVMRWRQPREGLSSVRPPVVNLNQEAVNAEVSIELPRDRWILWAGGGPLLGPAVQYWTYLVAALIFALALGALPWTRLKRWQWFLLAVGISQLSPVPAMIAVAWLPLLGLRRENYPKEGWFSFDVLQLVLVGFVCAGLIALYMAVERGLLGLPAMQVSGNGSYDGMLRWTADRVAGPLPAPVVFSAPLWMFRVVMLAWSLWLAVSLLSWLRWGWECFSTGDVLRSPKRTRSRSLRRERKDAPARKARERKAPEQSDAGENDEFELDEADKGDDA